MSMTAEKLKKANDLQKRIETLEGLIQNAKNQKCEWIDFTFGNGSNRANVCNDSSIIEKVKDLIIVENELKLERLKNEFLKL